MSERLTPIPTPPAHLWRQIRLQYLPAIVFAAGLVAAAIIWMRWVAPPTLVGEAETIRAEVRSHQVGSLSEIKVDIFQAVKAGQEIGRMAIADPRVLEASLAVIRAEIEVIRLTMDPVIAQQRMVLDFERLQLDWMSERVKLAALKAQLQLAEGNLARSEPLHRNKLLTDERFEELKSARDSLAAQAQAQTELIARIEPGLKNLSPEGLSGATMSPAAGLRAALKVEEEKLRLTELQLGTVALTSPIDGVVSLVYRRVGETVTAGEPILQITATRVARIVGYLRPPLTVEPKAGMEVEVRTRTFQRQRAQAAISGVGSQLEPITPTLLSPRHYWRRCGCPSHRCPPRWECE
jgi:multidrug resistance efflux pump